MKKFFVKDCKFDDDIMRSHTQLSDHYGLSLELSYTNIKNKGLSDDHNLSYLSSKIEDDEKKVQKGEEDDKPLLVG